MKWFKTEYRIVAEYWTDYPDPMYFAEMRMWPIFPKWEYVGGTATADGPERAEQKLRDVLAKTKNRKPTVIKEVTID